MDAISSPFKKAAEAIGNVWSSIKSFFKLPHFKITGSLDPKTWLEQGLPKLGVDWYYKGGIFNEPTVLPGGIGVGDRFNGKGSNPEAVVPLDSMYENIRSIVKEEGNSKDVYQEINIYSKTESPSELARQFKNSQKRLALEMA